MPAELESVRVLCGDMRELLAAMPAESVHAVVTDPPYGLEFMGKAWDQQVPGPDYWRQALRVCKPGAYLVAFGGTRTAHRLACALEDAGFDVRDCLSWLYGSGFPKSHNLEGEWDGWGTALKPAWEPIYLCRKPFRGSVASNVLEHACGALNVDGCRIAGAKPIRGAHEGDNGLFGMGSGYAFPGESHVGRWPANLVLDEEAARLLDAQTGELKSGNLEPHHRLRASLNVAMHGPNQERNPRACFGGDSGGASRFFYVAKASRSEREAGLERFTLRNGCEVTGRQPGSTGAVASAYAGTTQSERRNTHPTVKPVSLMRWLVRLITPPGGTVLDPFTGSGTTGVAAVLEGARFIGCELSAEFAELARARIAHAADEDDDQLALFDRTELKPVVKAQPAQASFLWPAEGLDHA